MFFSPSVQPLFQKTFMFPERFIKLHAMIISCGHSRIDSASYRFAGENRGNTEFIVWQYTLAGRGRIQYEGTEQDLEPGQAMMVHIPHPHCYFFPEESPFWEFVYVCLNGSEIVRICVELERKAGPVFDLDTNAETLLVADEILSGAYKNQIETAADGSLLAYRFGMALAKDLGRRQRQAQKKPELIRKVTAYCMEHLRDPITVEDLAIAAGYSRYHFSRLFQESEGVSPAAFLKDLRLRKAVRLLQLEPLSIGEIAERCGFASESYFCRAFRHAYGTAPGKYRNGK